MYKRFSGAKWLILSIITCGLYNLIMWIRMTKQHNKMAESIGAKKIMGFIPQLLLGCITFGIVSFIWIIKFYCQISRLNVEKKAGIIPANAFLIFLMSIIPVYSYFWLASANNKLIDAYTEKVTEEAAVEA